jgi:hypothetical protein
MLCTAAVQFARTPGRTQFPIQWPKSEADSPITCMYVYMSHSLGVFLIFL